jgi:hypothetical protein
MKAAEYKLLFKMLFFSALFYGIHKFVFAQFLPINIEQKFVYSLELLYCFFFFSSVLILVILFAIYKKNINNVGFTFLFLTVAKMGIAFFFLQPILKANESHLSIEKKNFLIVFLIFLAIETVVAVKILNNKQ